MIPWFDTLDIEQKISYNSASSLQGGIVKSVAFVCMIFGIVCNSTHGIVQKYLFNEKALSLRESLLFGHGIGFLFFFSAVWWWNGTMDSLGLATTPHYEPTLFYAGVFWVTACNIFIQFAQGMGKLLAHISLTAPYQGLTPGLITLTAFLFKEFPAFMGGLGIIIISVFTYIHGREGAKTIKEWLQPMRIIFFLPENFNALTFEDKEKALNTRSGVRWSFASAIVGVGGILGDSTVSRYGNLAEGLAIQFAITFVCYLLIPKKIWTLLNRGQEEVLSGRFGKRVNGYSKHILLLGLAFPLHWISISTAYRLAPIAYIGSMKRLSIAVTVVMAWFFLKERKAMRLLTGIMISIGGFLIGMDGRAQARITDFSDQKLRMFFSR